MIAKKFTNLQSNSPFKIPESNNSDSNIQNDSFKLNSENKFNNINAYNNIKTNNNNFNHSDNYNYNYFDNNIKNNIHNKLRSISPNLAPNYFDNENNSLLNTESNQKNLSKFEKMIQNTSELRNSTATQQTNPNQGRSNISLKWSNIVKKSKQEVLKLDLSQSEVLSSTNQLDFSALSENMDDLNDIIEENYHVVTTENSFLRQESHSILPFLFLSSREIHRMCLSDYEIKLVNKSIKNKIKNNRLDWMDYYKKGLIKFYQAKYFDSYMNFKAAYNMRNKDKEISKWLAFIILIIIFCANTEAIENSQLFFNDFSSSFMNLGNENKNSFYNNKNNNLGINSNYSNSGSNINNSDDEDNPLFSCCSSRKSKIKTIAVSSRNNTFQSDREQIKLNKSSLCRDLENILNDILDSLIKEDPNSTINLNKEPTADFLSKESAYKIEIWWMLMIISVYVKIKPEQKAFTNFFDPKHCVKKIKDKDVYLGYLAYAEYNTLINKNFNPESIFVEIIYKYPKRIEGYLKLWSRLVKGPVKEYKKAHSLSEVFWKNSSIIQFDNDVY